ncbi:hypothetical protein EV191_1461, partial [Tamaricihabitans halophyticus]
TPKVDLVQGLIALTAQKRWGVAYRVLPVVWLSEDGHPVVLDAPAAH